MHQRFYPRHDFRERHALRDNDSRCCEVPIARGHGLGMLLSRRGGRQHCVPTTGSGMVPTQCRRYAPNRFRAGEFAETRLTD